MNISNFKLHKGLSFEQYQALPGLSYSGLKGGTFTPTARMRLGTAVHQYILEPERFKGDTAVIRPLANTLLRVVGASLFKYLICECAITCDMEHGGIVMPYKGRPDMLLPGKIVLDFKVGENIRASMEHFGYRHAMSGYSLAGSTPVALLITVNPKTRKPDVIPVKIDESYWCEQILLRGNILV